MSHYIFAVVIIYLIFIVFWVLKKQHNIKNTTEFLSIDSFDSSEKLYQTLGRSFEASTASFATIFLGLFSLAQINLFYALYLIIGYLLGIYFFARFITPKLKSHIENKTYYPELMSINSGSRLMGVFISSIVTLSLLAFYYTEIFSFSHSLLINHDTSTTYSNLISIGLILLLSWYISIGGYRNIVITDFIQIIFIRIGMLALLLMSVYLLLKISSFELINEKIYSDFETFPHLIYMPALLFSFTFSQVIYYEYWQRLIVFYHALDNKKRNIDAFTQQASSQYISSIKYLLFIFCTPIAFGLVANLLEIPSLYALLNYLWLDSFLGKILVLSLVLAFMSALLSTVDTYLLGIIQTLVNQFPNLSLTTIRLLVILLSIGIIPFLFLNIDIGQWFKFLFYLGYPLAGPLLLVVFGFYLNRYILWVSMLTSLFACIYFYSSDYIDLIAAIVIIGSLLINYWFGDKKQNIALTADTINKSKKTQL